MMYYLECSGHDPRFHLALEHYVFHCLDRRHSYFLLSQNDNAVMVGRHQNTLTTVDPVYAARHQLQVVRRLSGGGAVYHDLGTVNYTFISGGDSSAGYDFSTFSGPIVEVLRRMGLPAQLNGRNDITIDGRKCSGSAQYRRDGRVLHHGTLFFDTDLEARQQALTVFPVHPASRYRIEPVTNIRPHLERDLDTLSFLRVLRSAMFSSARLEPYRLTEGDLSAVQAIQAEIYDRWDWNYGSLPPCRFHKELTVEDCGQVEAWLNTDPEGTITSLHFFGDYFGDGDSCVLARRFLGVPLEEDALRAALAGVDLEPYFHGMDREAFLSLLLS